MNNKQTILSTIATLTNTLTVVGVNSPLGVQIQVKLTELVKKV